MERWTRWWDDGDDGCAIAWGDNSSEGKEQEGDGQHLCSGRVGWRLRGDFWNRVRCSWAAAAAGTIPAVARAG